MQALREFTTMRVGGVPASLVRPQTREELIEACLEVWGSGEDWLLLGGGSNIVAADELPLLNVVKVETSGIQIDQIPSGALVRVQAGENWDDFVAHTVAAGLSGIEALSGIPGTVGAAPVQNIGAYGQEVADVITRLEFLDYLTGETEIIENKDLGFGYRDSIFKQGRLGAIIWVEFKLAASAHTNKTPRLIEALDNSTETPLEVRKRVLRLRHMKGMVLHDPDHDTWSCGSFFTNPIVPNAVAALMPDECPRWDVADEDYQKLSAAWLIENSGVGKGFSLGGSKAGTSTKHCLAITNRGDATAEEVLELARFIQVSVSNRFGVNLVPEPNLIGF
ncbi:MAG: UDP-N-acetylmuramate dehydrogenase [Micrococcales bacterium]